MDLDDHVALDELLRGAARHSRYEDRFRPNPDGEERTLDEALEIASRHGIDFDPAEYRVLLDQVSRSDCYASYFDLDGVAHGSFVPWSRITARDGRIVIRVQRSILVSDEMILAALAHEHHETQALRLEFERNGGCLPARRLRELVESSGESLHNAAWDFADELLDRLRAEGRSP